MHTQDLITRYLTPTPGARTRLGDEVFLAVPLYKAKRICRPVYINRAAYQAIFNPAELPTWDDMAAVLSTLFSTTIEPEHGTGDIVATAYVDRQSDPLDMSLSGNLGSGRAYYAGAAFNIKGERTPLATATKKQFSDGFLEMERALWETLVACGLQGAISTGLNDVLAVIDMDDTCTVGWRDAPVKRAKVIRLDDGCLDRVTHLFHAPRPVDAQSLHSTAACYGRLEADKFCQRIVHGTWSPGNISLAGHLIDFDTVCATKGRGPVYSSTRWYHQNRFGFEHGGQATILNALSDHRAINADDVTAQDLHATMMQAMADTVALNFIKLMGFDDTSAIYAQHRDDIDALCALWQEISRKVYPCGEALLLKDTRAHHVHVFDTALFMAAYPLAVTENIFDPADMLALMMDDSLADDLLADTTTKPMTEIEQHHQDAVDAVIGEHVAHDSDARDILALAALAFIKKYHRVFSAIVTTTGADILRVQAQALARNDDRRALFPALTATFRLAENKTLRSDRHIDSIMRALIESCRRDGDDGVLAIRHAIYDEGHFAIVLDGQGQHRLRFQAHVEFDQPSEIKWENKAFSLDENGLSSPYPNALLWPLLQREAPLQIPEISIYSQIEHINAPQLATPI